MFILPLAVFLFRATTAKTDWIFKKQQSTIKTMPKKPRFIYLILICPFLLTACTVQDSSQSSLPFRSEVTTAINSNQSENVNTTTVVVNNANTNTAVEADANSVVSEFITPLDRPTKRISKKPFGIYITPATSPVQPERFSGYHTGADFETFSDEAEAAVEVRAFCSGEIAYKQRLNGYGGVLIQQCLADNQAVTVLYGHLSLDSIGVKVGDSLAAGETLGQLGQGGSYDTDGERKHLHFGIHLGSTINVKGYVSAQSDLSSWLDPHQFLK